MTLFSFRMPFRQLRGNGTRFALTIVAVACGVALVCAIDLANRAVFEAFAEVIDTMAGRASLYVGAGETGLVPEAVAERVTTVAGVELAVPVVTASAFLTDGSGQQLLVHGVDVANDAAVRVYEPDGPQAAALEDPLVFLSRPDSVLLTRDFADRHGLRAGDPIELQTPIGRLRFTVRGLLAPRGLARAQGGNLVLMDIQAAERVFSKPGFASRIDVVVARGADLEVVESAVRAVLPPGLRVERPAQRRVNLHRVIGAAQTVLQAVALLGVAAAFLIAFSRLSTVFEARAWQVAVLRAAGVRSRRVWWELTKESVVVGLAGVAVGIPFGVVVGRVALPVIATTTALSAKLPTGDAVMRIRAPSIALAAAMGIATVMLAAALPAWRAARTSIADTLGRRGVEQAGLPASSGGLARLIVAALALGVTAFHVATGDVVAGLVATGSIVACAALVVRPLLATLERPLAALARPLAGAAGRLAVASMLARPRRSALAVTTLGVGFGTVLWLWTVAASFEQSVRDVLPNKLRGDLSVGSAHLEAGYSEAAMDGALIGALATVPGVAVVVGERSLDWWYAGGPISLDAFDPAYFVDPRFGPLALVDRRDPDALDAVARGAAVLVSDNFRRNLRVGVGDVVTLDTPTGPLALPIAGVLPDFLSPRGTIDLSRDLFRARWGDDQVVRGLVEVTPNARIDEVRDTIASRLGLRYGLRVLTLRALVEWFGEQVRRGFAAFDVLALLVMLVVLVGVGDALAATTLERTREFGMTRALGVRRRVLRRAVVLEGLLLGALGLALAAGIGLALGGLWVSWTFPALVGWTLAFHLPAGPIAMIGAAVMLVCLVGSWVPALHAARLDPVVALRAE